MKALQGLLLFLFVPLAASYAQHSVGELDNYSGSSSAWINPSNLSTTFVYADFCVGPADLSLNNNFAYIPQSELWPSVSSLLSQGTWPSFPGIQDIKYYYAYYPEEESRFIYESADLTLPSFMMTFKGRHALAFSFRTRTGLSVEQMPWEIPVLATESFDYDSLHLRVFQSEGMRFAAMGWGEADVSYSVTALESSNYKLDLGLTGKLLLGVAGITGSLNYLEYELFDAYNMLMDTVNGAMSMALPLDYEANLNDHSSSPWFTEDLVKGLGWGADFGFSLTRKKMQRYRLPETACEDSPLLYYWRLGVSLVDFGKIRFNKNTLNGTLLGKGMLFDRRVVFADANSVTDMVEVMDDLMGWEETMFEYDSSFCIGLPTALSLQFDVNAYRNFYVNATLVQPISSLLYENSVKREMLFSVTPRYETGFLGVALPLSLYGSGYSTVGAFLRVGPLQLGTNDLLSLAGWRDTKGADFMVRLQLKLKRGDCLLSPLEDACGDKYRFRKSKR